eukprot:GFKZ01013109.1.p1 GENE.GFKZ01013109.1~~GFKZ01013109.1.p1  ORF type:complete len:350 (+),score=49.09 GFKZ01013109.1:234-1283(+)
MRVPLKFSSTKRLLLPIALATLLTLILLQSHLKSVPTWFSLSGSPSVFQISPASLHLHDADISFAARRKRALPLCAHSATPAKTFLIAFMGHSGSSAITSELRSHSQISIGAMEPVDHENTPNSTVALNTTRRLFLDGIARGKTTGFKIRPTHVLDAPEEWGALVEEFDTRIVWQYRKNLFKASVGDYARDFYNDTAVVGGFRRRVSREERCAIGAGCSFRIDDMQFLHGQLKGKLKSQNAITEAVDVLSRGNGCVWEVPYEDYLYHGRETMEGLFKFLGVGSEETQPERFKATGDNLCEVIENWDDVCQAFYGCIAWQHMMDDARNQCFCEYAGGPAAFCSSTDKPNR